MKSNENQSGIQRGLNNCTESRESVNEKIIPDDFRSWKLKKLAQETKNQYIEQRQVDNYILQTEFMRRNSVRLLPEEMISNQIRYVEGNSNKDFSAVEFNKRFLQLQKTKNQKLPEAQDCARPKKYRRNGYLCPGNNQIDILSNDWESVMVESVGLVLQRWRGVCSFSQSVRGYWSENKDNYEFIPHPKKQVQPKDWLCSDQTKRFILMTISIK